MNQDKLLKQLIRSTVLLTELIEDCDHSVGICYCDDWDTLHGNKMVIEEVTKKDWKNSGIKETPLIKNKMDWFEIIDNWHIQKIDHNTDNIKKSKHKKNVNFFNRIKSIFKKMKEKYKGLTE